MNEWGMQGPSYEAWSNFMYSYIYWAFPHYYLFMRIARLPPPASSAPSLNFCPYPFWLLFLKLWAFFLNHYQLLIRLVANTYLLINHIRIEKSELIFLKQRCWHLIFTSRLLSYLAIYLYSTDCIWTYKLIIDLSDNFHYDPQNE